jgi:xanthine dehydrogenase accessory factor
MTRSDIADRAAELRRARAPYVHARVVLAERPTSAKPGDEALVLADGTIEGFVGGSCAETTVRSQSLALLDSGESVLLRITPLPEPDQPGKVTVHNECLSGGTFEVFLEPVLPPVQVVVVGDTPIARALDRLVTAMGYEVVGAGGDDPSELANVSAVVVASHGRDEEGPLGAALRAGVPYVGLVASRRRGPSVVDMVDAPEEERARVRTPAGLDIGARTPEEVALSILAEVVAARPQPRGRAGAATTDGGGEHVHDADGPGVAVDPVCGMTVATVPSSLHRVHEGVTYWFCGTGCLRAFADDPEPYLRTRA